ncbi:MAG: hypothetical protein LQ340_005425 [Diploschistes diacapsis]|nr:MAG: hypothetical protein LQ340_005425 [Diploschistes diacapsis]
MNRHDPRVRQTLDRISSTFESAQLNTQASLYTFSARYITPCLNSFSSCLESACYPCIGARRDRVRARQRRNQLAANRGRPEFIFDFYTADWDDEEDETEQSGLLSGWGADELDRLLAGGSGAEQPKRQNQMNYGTGAGRRRRRSTGVGKGGEGDPTLLPGSSMFGFLERLPWNLGNRGVRYKPSAAGLQDVAGESRKDEDNAEASALLEESEDERSRHQRQGGERRHRRNRSATVNSQSTMNSLSSRGDLFPSEDEAADAVPLDDEFAITLSRRSTSNDDFSSGMMGKAKSSRSMSKSTAHSRTRRTSLSRTHTGRSSRKHGSVVAPSMSVTESVASSEKSPSSVVTRTESDDAAVGDPSVELHEDHGLPSMAELHHEEEQVRQEEEAEVQRKRDEAQQVAYERGLEASPLAAGRSSHTDGTHEQSLIPPATISEAPAPDTKGF